MAAQEKLVLACDMLKLFARWAPPARATHRRYDTWFFATEAPTGQQAREDGNEATEAIWISPSKALEAKKAGDRKMIFPTTRNVELLEVSDNTQSVLKFAQERKIELVQPEIVQRDGEMLLAIPEGLGYPVTTEPLEQVMRG